MSSTVTQSHRDTPKTPNFNEPSNFFKNHAWLIGGVIFSLALVALVGNFLRTHERVLDTPNYSLTPQASMNRFLASERLLQGMHKNVHTTQGELAKTALDEMWQQPSEQAKRNAVMLYSVSKSQEASIPKMLNWVQKGGHLVTFSHAILSYSALDRQDDDDVKQYQLGENVLLNELGIVHIANDKIRASMQPFDNPLPQNQASATSRTPQLSLDNKVVMRLPTVTANQNNPNQAIETVIHIDNNTYLDSEKFWKKYPNAQKWADYNWLNDSNQLVAPTQTLLNLSEQQQLTTYISEQEKKSKPSPKAEAVMLDVKLGEGRMTILNSKNVFSNPTSGNLQGLDEKRENLKSSAENNPPNRIENASHSPLWQLLQNNHAMTDNAENIASLDNAYLLKYLMADRQQIWLVPDIDVPSLPLMLWRSAKWACVAFLLLLAVGMLAIPKRFGRLRSYQSDSERNIFGYFDHVGQYLWHTDKAQALFSQNRTRLIEQIFAKHPQFAKYDPDQLCQALGEQLTIGKSAVNQGLFSDWQNAEQFLQCTRQFAVIRQAYG